MSDDEAMIAKVMNTTGIDRAGAEQALRDGRRLAAQLIALQNPGLKPKPSEVVRLFLNGTSIAGLAVRFHCEVFDIEQCLRRHLERLLAKKNGKAKQ